jgi:hypothetical protein
MHTLLLITALLASHGESRTQRAAHLMTADERATLASFDTRTAALPFDNGLQALRTSSIALLSIGAVPVIGVAVVALGASFITGFAAGLSGVSWGGMFVDVMGSILKWVPGAIWVVTGVALVAGAAMLIASIVADQPRQKALKAIRVERRDFIRSIERRGEAPTQVPMTTLLTF